MNAITLYRIASWLYERNIPLLPRLLQYMIFFMFNSYIPYQTKIGSGTRVGHRGIGVVINKDSVIGSDVLIRAHVTIGKKYSGGKAPVIGDGVELGDGSKILGDIFVGKNSVVGANAVVVKNVPADAVAIGVPAKIINRK